jgi:outer membrane immunogenic protein
MKKVLLSTVAFAGLTVGALAADLPSRRAPAPYVAVPVFTWTGLYVGVNAGYGFSDSDKNFGYSSGLFANGTGFGTGVTPVTPFGTSVFGGNNNNNRDGFVGGGQLGYNYQIGSFVIGVEGDIQYTDFGKRGSGNFGTAVPNANIGAGSPNIAFLNTSNKSDYFGTVRGRVGYAFDRALVYGTGGVAFRDTGNGRDYTFGFPGFQRNKAEDTGYAVGGGVEYAFTPNLTGKIEGLYVNFSDSAKGNTYGGNLVGVTNAGRPVITIGSTKRDDDFVVVRAGLNYKFNLF